MADLTASVAKSHAEAKHQAGGDGTFDSPRAREREKQRALGGPGSGNFGHSGRPGEVGGSSGGSGSPSEGTNGSDLGEAKAPDYQSSADQPGILDAIKQADGGFTYHVVTGDQPKTGYALSIHKDRERVIPVEKITLQELARYAKDNIDLLSQDDKYVGGWHNPDNGMAYLDVSKVVSTPAEAEELAREHNQEAYFDFANGRSVKILYPKAARHAYQTGIYARRPEEGTTHSGRPDRALQEADGEGAEPRRHRRGAQDLSILGGPGSGNFGHAGRPGEVGGSASEGGGASDEGTSSGDSLSEDSESYKLKEDPAGAAPTPELEQQAVAGIASVEKLYSTAVDQANYSEVGDPDEQGSFDDPDAVWAALGKDAQENAYYKFEEGARDSAYDSIDTSDISNDFADNLRRNNEDIISDAKSETLNILASIGFGKSTEPTLPFVEGDPELRKVLDPDSIVPTDDDGDGDGASLDLEQLRWKNGDPLSEEEQETVGNVWDDKYKESFDNAFDNRYEDSEYQEAESNLIDMAIKDEWANTDYKEKLTYVNEDQVSQAVSQLMNSVEPGEPDQWVTGTDPETTRDEDYLRTTAIARKLVELRTHEIALERETPSMSDMQIGKAWSMWKSSSTTDEGKGLQLAAAEELGGVSRFTPEEISEIKSVYTPDEYNALKTYVRAQWETNQWLMKKSGEDYVDVYRAVILPKALVDATTKTIVNPDPVTGGMVKTKLPDLQLLRSGAQSTTGDSSVANQWNGVGVAPFGDNTRVVLRIRAPRTSVLSLPVFGQNIHGEHETVLAGTKDKWWWDAWHSYAPKFSVEPPPNRHLRAAAEDEKKKPLVVDLFEIDKAAGTPDWMQGTDGVAARVIEKKRSERARAREKKEQRELGSSKSGNYGHAGRPGKRGGSAPRDGGEEGEGGSKPKGKGRAKGSGRSRTKKSAPPAAEPAPTPAPPPPPPASTSEQSMEEIKKALASQAMVTNISRGVVWPKGTGPRLTPSDLQNIENLIRHQDYESFVAIGKDGHAVAAFSGTKNAITIPDYLSASPGTAKNPMRGATLTHNHPSGSSFSINDLATFDNLRNAEIRAVGVTPDGKRIEYSMKNEGLTRIGDKTELFALGYEAQNSVLTPARHSEVRDLISKDPGRNSEISREAYFHDSHKIITKYVELVKQKYPKTKWTYTRTIFDD